MPIYKKYEKEQLFINGVPAVPSQYRKGKLIKEDWEGTLENCQNGGAESICCEGSYNLSFTEEMIITPYTNVAEEKFVVSKVLNNKLYFHTENTPTDDNYYLSYYDLSTKTFGNKTYLCNGLTDGHITNCIVQSNSTSKIYYSIVKGNTIGQQEYKLGVYNTINYTFGIYDMSINIFNSYSGYSHPCDGLNAAKMDYIFIHENGNNVNIYNTFSVGTKIGNPGVTPPSVPFFVDKTEYTYDPDFDSYDFVTTNRINISTPYSTNTYQAFIPYVYNGENRFRIRQDTTNYNFIEYSFNPENDALSIIMPSDSMYCEDELHKVDSPSYSYNSNILNNYTSLSSCLEDKPAGSTLYNFFYKTVEDCPQLIKFNPRNSYTCLVKNDSDYKYYMYNNNLYYLRSFTDVGGISQRRLYITKLTYTE